MKIIIAIIVLITIYFNLGILNKHVLPEDEASFKDLKIMGGALIFNTIVLVAILFLTILVILIKIFLLS